MNSWTNSASGKWEVSSNWSLGVAPAAAQSIFVTNAGSKTITVDATTSSGFPSTMTVNSLLVGASSVDTNLLLLTNVGMGTPLLISNGVTIASGGVLSLTNSFLWNTATFTVDGGGSVWVNSGLLVSTNTYTSVGGGQAATLVVSNGTVQLRDLYAQSVNSEGSVKVAGGTLTTQGFTLGNTPGVTGVIWVVGGYLGNSGSVAFIGNGGNGKMIVSNGTFVCNPTLYIGNAPGSVGTLTVAGGGVWARDELYAGPATSTTGSVWITGSGVITNDFWTTIGGNGIGQLVLSNGILNSQTLQLGGRPGFMYTGTGTLTMMGGTLQVTTFNCAITGRGQFSMSGGVAKVQSAQLGNLNTSVTGRGTFTLSGGTLTVTSQLDLGVGNNGSYSGSGAIWLNGGQLFATNGFTSVGLVGSGRLTVSNGLMLARRMTIGSNGVASGTLTIAGGQLTVFDGVTLGNCATNATGRLLLNGGVLYVTNATHTGTIDVRKGSVTVSNGVLVADKLVVTNSCGRFTKAGGTLFITTLVLDPDLDADGDGIPNGWEQAYGLDPLNPADANADPDGDGQNNLAEYQTGTDPTNSASAFRITAIAREANDVRVTWSTAAGKTNALQAAAGDAVGNYSNNFTDIVIITNTTGSVTNYLDADATSFPSRFYRVRLVP